MELLGFGATAPSLTTNSIEVDDTHFSSQNPLIISGSCSDKITSFKIKIGSGQWQDPSSVGLTGSGRCNSGSFEYSATADAYGFIQQNYETKLVAIKGETSFGESPEATIELRYAKENNLAEPPDRLTFVRDSNTRLKVLFPYEGLKSKEFLVMYIEEMVAAPDTCSLSPPAGWTVQKLSNNNIDNELLIDAKVNPDFAPFTVVVCGANDVGISEPLSGQEYTLAAEPAKPIVDPGPKTNVSFQVNISAGDQKTAYFVVRYSETPSAFTGSPTDCDNGIAVTQNGSDKIQSGVVSVDGLNPLTTYYYAVCAYNNNPQPHQLRSDSYFSSVVTLANPASPLTAAPGFSSKTPSQISLSFNSAAVPEPWEAVKIYYKPGRIAPAKCSDGTSGNHSISTALNGTLSSQNDLKSGQFYSFTICTYRSNGYPSQTLSHKIEGNDAIMTGLLLTHFGSSATDRKWNHYIDTQILVADGSAFDPYKISNTYNNHSGYPYYTAGDCVVIHGESKNQCHHAGLMRVVLVPGFQTCDSSLSLVDDLSLFNWQCEEIQGGGGIRFVLRGFRPTKKLSDAIDWGNTSGAFTANFVRLYESAMLKSQSLPSIWWTNAVTYLIDNTTTKNGDDVFLLKAGQANVYNLLFDTSGASLVVQPGHFLGGAGTFGAKFSYTNFIWIEGVIGYIPSHTNGNSGLELNTVSFANLDHVKSIVNNTDYGIYLSNVEKSNISDVVSVATKVGDGIKVVDSTKNSFNNIFISNSGDNGIFFDTSSKNTITNLLTVNNTSSGFKIEGGSSSNENVLSFVTTAQNGANGVIVTNVSGINYFAAFGILAFTNTLNGIRLGNNTWPSFNGSFKNILSISNGLYGLVANWDSDTFNSSGYIGIHSNASDACFGSIFDPDCGSRWGTSYNPLIDNSFLGLDGGSSVGALKLSSPGDSYSLLTANNPYLQLAKDINSPVLINAGHRGPCSNTGTCYFIDWSLLLSDISILNRGFQPDATNGELLSNETNCPSSLDPNNADNLLEAFQFGNKYLVHAKEILNDNIGNDNGLCESNETCLWAPNVGAYQGHTEVDLGDLHVGPCLFNNASNESVKDVKVYRLNANGR